LGLNNIKKSFIAIPLILSLNTNLCFSQDVFGSFKNPEYKITKSIENNVSGTYKSTIGKRLMDLAYEGVDYKTKRDAFLIKTNNKVFQDKYDDLKAERRSIKSNRESLCSPNRYGLSVWSEESFDVNTREVLEDVVRSATGKEIPDEVKIKFGISNGKLGHHSPVSNNIRIKEGPKAEEIMTGLHELGHAFSQQREAGIYDNKEKRDVMEEASAFAFSVAGSYFIEDSSLSKSVRKRVLRYIEGEINSYFNEEINTDEHNKGAAIADAAITYFKDSGKAYNYLSTTHYNELKGEIFDIILNNKITYNNSNLYFENKLEKAIKD